MQLHVCIIITAVIASSDALFLGGKKKSIGKSWFISSLQGVLHTWIDWNIYLSVKKEVVIGQSG